MIPGVDLSDNNGPTDNPALAAFLLGQDPDAIAAVKVSESAGRNGYVSRTLDQQRRGLHAAALRWLLLYHFGRASENTGRAEAEFFLKTIGDHGGILKGEALVLDLEDERVPWNAPLQAYVDDFRDTITSALGIKVIVYSRDDYLKAHGVTVAPSEYWCAAPGAATAPNCLIWQYSWHGQVPGVSGPVDLDYLTGPISTLQPFQWGMQPDPVAGKPATRPPDVSGDVLSCIKGARAAILRNDPETAVADIDEAITKFGLIGA